MAQGLFLIFEKTMFINYLKTSFRNLIRDKSYSAINILGLAIGVAACLLISLYITDELSYDKFHKDSERIYRMYVDGRFGNNRFYSPNTSNPLKETLLNEYSQVENATHFFNRNQVQLRHSNNVVFEDKIFYVDSSFFDVFSFELLKGNPDKVLKKPGQIILTEQMANKYFGKDDPIGEIFRLNGKKHEIVGICKNTPDNSHFHFNILASYEGSYWSKDNNWINSGIYTYIKLEEGTRKTQFERQMNGIVTDHIGPAVSKWMGIDLEEFQNQGNSYGFFLQPLEDIYLHSDFNDEIEPVSDISRVWFFSVIAIFILLIACINFMNLATAKYASRAKEVGIRKVVGSRKKQLISQFLTESILVTFISVILAIVIVEISLPWFNQFAHKSLAISHLGSWYVIPILLGLSLLIGIITGTYPAFFLSSFKPVKILKGKINQGVKGNKMRGILVTAQFVITIFLFISTYIIYQQNHYMTNKKLGFDKEKVIVLDHAYYLNNNLESFINEIKKNPSIQEATVATCLPGKNYHASTFQVETKSPEEMVFFNVNYVKEGYFDVMGIELLEGRAFSKDFSTNSQSVLINKKAASDLGLKSPIGKYIQLGKNKFTITGIIDNYHFQSLHRDIEPLALRYIQNNNRNYLPVRIHTNDIKNTIEYLNKQWDEFTNGIPFNYFFIDNQFNQLYNSEQRIAKVFTMFSILAIFIACLGLLGLSAFMAEKRTKEIGIRKVHGAKPINILQILYKEVFLLLILSTLIAWPMTYFVMNQWLENFAYKTSMEITPFFVSSLVALLIAIFTTSSQAVKAAGTNPAHILKDE